MHASFFISHYQTHLHHLWQLLYHTFSARSTYFTTQLNLLHPSYPLTTILTFTNSSQYKTGSYIWVI